MTDCWNLYLLEGVVALAPGDGPMLLVESGSEKAASPIAFLKPRKYTVTATTKVSFLWIHDVLLKVVLDGGRPPAAAGHKDPGGLAHLKYGAIEFLAGKHRPSIRLVGFWAP